MVPNNVVHRCGKLCEDVCQSLQVLFQAPINDVPKGQSESYLTVAVDLCHCRTQLAWHFPVPLISPLYVSIFLICILWVSYRCECEDGLGHGGRQQVKDVG